MSNIFEDYNDWTIVNLVSRHIDEQLEEDLSFNIVLDGIGTTTYRRK